MKKLAVFMLCTVLLVSSCQKTPEREIVIGKNSGKLERAINKKPPETDNNVEISTTPAIKEIEHPERWQASYVKYNGKLNMTVDAEVIVEDVAKYPVTKIKPYYIPIEQANKIVKEIFGDDQVYHIEMERTKEQIEEFIVGVKADYQKAKKEKDKEQMEYLKTIINDLVLQLEDAPEEATLIPYDGEYKVYKDSKSEHHWMNLRRNPLDIYTPVLQIHNFINAKYSNGFDSRVTYENCMVDGNGVYIDRDNMHWDYRKNPVLQTENAKKAIDKANRFLENIGIKDVVVSNMLATISDTCSKEIIGYQMEYSRVHNDIVIPLHVSAGGNMTRSKSDEYIQRLHSEILTVEVEGDDIIYFEWCNMFDIDKVLCEDVELIPFKKAVANAESQLAAKYACADKWKKVYNFYVDRIILTYSTVPIKNKNYEYMLVPVWAFYGGEDFGDGVEVADGIVAKGKSAYNCSLLTINAIDGSIISGG
jgi:hypothetical protein